MLVAARAEGRRDKAGMKYEDLAFPNLVSTLGGTARSFLQAHFPVKPEPPTIPEEPVPPPNPTQESIELHHILLRARAEAIRIRDLPPDSELVALRDKLASRLSSLALPPNPLDQLVDMFGGPGEVAEMTGRAGRILREEGRSPPSFKYKKRGGAKTSKGLSSAASQEVELDQLNISERKQFQDGKKKVAIISDAASTGISLNANSKCASSGRRRVHYTIELPWAADKAIQQLGRSHRAGQTTAPIYRNCVTNLGGERRFAAAVSKVRKSEADDVYVQSTRFPC